MSNREPDFTFLRNAHTEESFGTRSIPDSVWPVNNSSLMEYSEKANFGNRLGLMQLLDTQIGRTDDVGLDIAGGTNALALAGLVEARLIRAGAVTNFQDERTPRIKEMHQSMNITHISGDLVDRRTWLDVATWKDRVAPHGLAVVMHRPVCGLQGLRPRFYDGALHTILDWIRPGGVFFTQIPLTLTDRFASGYVSNQADALPPICIRLKQRPDVAHVMHSSNTLRRNKNNAGYESLYTYVAIIKKP